MLYYQTKLQLRQIFFTIFYFQKQTKNEHRKIRVARLKECVGETSVWQTVVWQKL